MAGQRRTRKYPPLTKDQQKLVNEHLWIAGYEAYRIRCAKWGNTGALAAEDLEQVARFALCVAAIQYDPKRGVKFSTYACNKAKGYLKHALRDKSRMVRTPRWVEGIRNKVNEGLQKNKSYEEIAQELGVDQEKVVISHMAEQNYHVSYDSSPEDWTTPEFLHEDDEVKATLSCPEIREELKKFTENEISTLLAYAEGGYLNSSDIAWAEVKFKELEDLAYGRVRTLKGPKNGK
jgi:DNA-directed RNA polymerase specialized sigma subunit